MPPLLKIPLGTGLDKGLTQLEGSRIPLCRISAEGEIHANDADTQEEWFMIQRPSDSDVCHEARQ